MKDKGKYVMLAVLTINVIIKATFGLIEAGLKCGKAAPKGEK